MYPKSSVSFTVWWERSARSGSFPDCWLFVPAWKLSCPSFGSFKNCQCITRVGSKNPMLLNSWGPSSKNTCTLVHSAQSGSCSALSLLSYPSSSFFLVSNWAIMFVYYKTWSVITWSVYYNFSRCILGFILYLCWSKKWHLTPVFLPGESHGQRNLAGYSPWGHQEMDMTEHLSKHAYFTSVVWRN